MKARIMAKPGSGKPLGEDRLGSAVLRFGLPHHALIFLRPREQTDQFSSSITEGLTSNASEIASTASSVGEVSPRSIMPI